MLGGVGKPDDANRNASRRVSRERRAMMRAGGASPGQRLLALLDGFFPATRWRLTHRGPDGRSDPRPLLDLPPSER